MPQTSPYLIELSDEERKELESRARKYTAPYQEVVRANNTPSGERGLFQF